MLEELDLAPDGSFAIVTRRSVEGERVRLAPVARAADGDGAEPRRLTTGTVRDMEPRIAPDGTRVVFTRATPAVHRQDLRILDLRGGESVSPALGELSAGDVAWSPDGRRIAFRARTDPQRLIVGPVPKPGDKDAKEPRARRVTTLDYRWDETGYLDRHRQLHVVEAGDGAVPRVLTSLACGVDAFAWRPDGRAIAIVADPREDADLHPRTSIWEVDAQVGAPGAPARRAGDGTGPMPEPREILALAGPVARPAYSPDGRWIAAVGVDDPDYFDDLSPTLFVGPADGSAPAVALAPDLDRPVGDWSDTDLTGWQGEQSPGPSWDGPTA